MELIGKLVTFNEWPCVGRIVDQGTETHGVLCLSNGEVHYFPKSLLAIVEDAEDQLFIDPSQPLWIRRDQLLDNLERLACETVSTAHEHLVITIKNWARGWSDGNELVCSSLAESVDNPRQVSWAEDAKHYDNDKRRRRGSWAAFLRKAVKNEWGLAITDKDIEAFSYLVGTHVPGTREWGFEVVRGDAVYDAYHSRWCPGSCMVGEDYVKFYSENPDKVGMLIINKAGNHYGRALLWTLDEPEGKMFLDRIYPSDGGDHIDAALRYAKAMGWLYKTSQTYGNYVSGSEHMVVEMKNVGHWPYMDTLRYTDNTVDDDYIVLNNHSGDYLLDSTEGQGPGDGDKTWSEYQGEYILEEDAVYVDSVHSYVDRNTLDNDFTQIRGGDYYMNDEVVEAHDGDYIRRDRAVELANGEWADEDEIGECDYTHDVVLNDDLVETYEGRLCRSDCTVRLSNGAWAWEDDENVVEVDGEWRLNALLVEQTSIWESDALVSSGNSFVVRF